MPPSSDQDTSNTTSGSPATNNNNHKLSQKHSAGLQIPSKNGKKNGTAKEGNGGGVLAAVTKNASRLSNKSSIMPKSQSPKMLPVTSTSNGNPVTSPLLDQLASAALPSSSTQNTNEWAKNVPAYSSSPSNLINLGESPPTLPSSYEDRVANFGGWSTRDQRIPNSYNPSASPPVGRRRPLSYQPDSSPFQPGTEDQPFQMSPYGRRTSMYSQSSRYPLPPLPHQPQAHFYGIPDVNHILSPRGPGLTPGENGFYCGFDNLPAQDPSKSPDNVLVTGYEGGFNVYVVHKRGLERTVNIDGLRGGVYNAKVIPWTVRGDSSIEFPLIAVVIHGPASISSVSSGEYAVASSDGNSVRQSDSVRGSPRLPQSIPENEPNVADYQTSVEVYSLNTKKLITTLLSGPKAPATVSNYSQIVAAPPPVGSLTIHADNGNLVVASGTTGETWIFRQGDSQGGQVHFRCIGKIWTTVQQGLPMSAAGVNGIVDGDWNSTETSSSSQQKHYKSSILSLNGRWLAYCPATPSSQISLRAAVPSVSGTAKVSGLNAQAPPQLPQVNCQVETPGGESMIGKIAQVATQEAIKGAAYVGRQGMQAWNNYWNKSTSQPTNGQHAYNPNLFPPTHGVAVPAPVVNKDPGLISILDLDALAQHNSSGPGSPHPLATFKVPAGCSFLSFSPSGLALFAASSNGDVQFVWDLMRLQHVKSSLLKGGFPGAVSQGPHVRQVARFTRMTIAKIVDVVWTKPHGERAAMVTEHGTVHILDLPASAFTWPPPRRRVTVPSSKDATAGNEPSTMPLSAAAAGVASSTISTLWNVAQPLVRTRRSSSGVTNSTATIASTQAGHGTQAQALKANISRSFGAATGRMNEMRKSSGKQVRVHLPQSPTPPGPACVRLASGRHHDLVIVIGNGIVRIYNIKSRRADRPADKQKASQGAKFVEHRVPSLPDQKVVPDNLSNLHLDDNFDNSDRDNEELRWAPRQTKGSSAVHSGTESSIPQAEIESNAPYQPFHTDRRVGLYIRSCVDVTPHSPSVSALLAPQSLPSTKDYKDTKLMSAWAFGGPIKAVKLDVGPRPMTEDEYDDPFDHRALPSSAIQRQLRVTDSSDGIDQIVVTTRIRHGARSRAGNGDIDEEGFFEDDCEVLDFASQRV